MTHRRRNTLIASLPLVALFALPACTASPEDCEKLGEKFAELFKAEQGKDAGLPEELLDSAVKAGQDEVVKQCKAEPPSKASMRCALEAKTMSELEGC